jgi:hypothetical protein
LERQDGVVWTGLLWLRNSVMSLWVPWNATKLSSGFTSGVPSSSFPLHLVSYGILTD